MKFMLSILDLLSLTTREALWEGSCLFIVLTSRVEDLETQNECLLNDLMTNLIMKRNSVFLSLLVKSLRSCIICLPESHHPISKTKSITEITSVSKTYRGWYLTSGYQKEGATYLYILPKNTARNSQKARFWKM